MSRQEKVLVRDIFGELAVKKELSNDGILPAGKISKIEGRKQPGPYQKCIWPHHKEDRIDRIVKNYGQGTGYSKWQKEQYPVKVERTRDAIMKAAMIR